MQGVAGRQELVNPLHPAEARAVFAVASEVPHGAGTSPSLIQRVLGTTSRTTVFRVLSEAGYLTSYSYAGRYYTLKEIPQFDTQGLWSYGEALFSKYGTLRATIVRFVQDAAAGQTHGELRERLRLRVHDTLPPGDAGIASVRGMTQWVLDFPADAQYQSFPFDRPYLDLYDRCVRARRAAHTFLRDPPEDPQVCKTLERLCRILDPANAEVPFSQVAERLRGRAELFDELRDALRLVPRTGGRNQTPPTHAVPVQEAIAELQDIKVAVERFTTSIHQRRPQRGPAQGTREAIDIVLQHLEEHGDSLWGHVISLPEEVGCGVRLVDRTNNSLESFFRGMKHGERRRSGRKNLTQDFESLPTEAALAYNLNCPDYPRDCLGFTRPLAPRVCAIGRCGASDDPRNATAVCDTRPRSPDS